MKIALTGAHGTGKTTLLNSLMGYSKFNNFKRCVETTRFLKNIGLPINQDGNDATQMLIMNTHAYNLLRYDNFITDRCSLDCYIYAQWLYINGNLSGQTLNEIKAANEAFIKMYDLIFYLEPLDFIEDDGVRDTNPLFQKQIADLFLNYISKHTPSNLYITIGDRNSRFQTVKRTVEMYQ